MKQLPNLLLFLLVFALVLAFVAIFASLSEGERNERANRFMDRLETLLFMGGMLILVVFTAIAGVVIAHLINVVSRAARLPGQQLPGPLGGLERQLEELVGTKEED